jgi:hypothetical protein
MLVEMRMFGLRGEDGARRSCKFGGAEQQKEQNNKKSRIRCPVATNGAVM